jgi:hypothetical protein
MLCLHYTLCLMQLSVVCNLILVEFSDWFATSGLLVIDAVGCRSMYFVVLPRVNLIVNFLTYHIYLYSINCPTVICLPSMCNLSYGETPLVNCGPQSYFHHIAITCLLYSHYLLYSHTLLFSTWYAHNLCFKQTGEIDNLIASWEQSIWLRVCRFRVAAGKQSLDEVPYINCLKLSQTSKHHLQSSLSTFLLDDKPWFLNWGKTCYYIHQNLLLGFSNWPVILLHQLGPINLLITDISPSTIHDFPIHM